VAAQEEEEYQDAVKRADLISRKGGESQDLVRAEACCLLSPAALKFPQLKGTHCGFFREGRPECGFCPRCVQILRRIAGEADAKRALKAILGHLEEYSASDADGAALQVGSAQPPSLGTPRPCAPGATSLRTRCPTAAGTGLFQRGAVYAALRISHGRVQPASTSCVLVTSLP
jgi:hypothetical protein